MGDVPTTPLLDTTLMTPQTVAAHFASSEIIADGVIVRQVAEPTCAGAGALNSHSNTFSIQRQ